MASHIHASEVSAAAIFLISGESLSCYDLSGDQIWHISLTKYFPGSTISFCKLALRGDTCYVICRNSRNLLTVRDGSVDLHIELPFHPGNFVGWDEDRIVMTADLFPYEKSGIYVIDSEGQVDSHFRIDGYHGFSKPTQLRNGNIAYTSAERLMFDATGSKELFPGSRREYLRVVNLEGETELDEVGDFSVAYDKALDLGDRLVILNAHGAVCVDFTGAELWKKAGQFFGTWTDCSESGLVAGADGDKILRVFNAFGEEQWSYATSRDFIGAAHCRSGYILIPENDFAPLSPGEKLKETLQKGYTAMPPWDLSTSTLRCLTESGTTVWKMKLDARGTSQFSPTLHSVERDKLLCITGNELRMIRLASGP